VLSIWLGIQKPLIALILQLLQTIGSYYRTPIFRSVGNFGFRQGQTFLLAAPFAPALGDYPAFFFKLILGVVSISKAAGE
jgi:hypothetical protein